MKKSINKKTPLPGEGNDRELTPTILSDVPTVTPEEQETIKGTILDALSTYYPDEIVTKNVSPEQVKVTLDRLARSKGIHSDTAIRAVSELIIKGAANARAKDTMALNIQCPVTGDLTQVSRYDITMALYSVVKHKTVRKLAEAMAPMILQGNLNILKRVPTADLKGDLAAKINRRLLSQAQNTPSEKTPPSPLTREEEVCCCTYAQWMPNLNELANSTRLKQLMEEDLLLRKPKTKARNSKGSNQPASKKQIPRGNKAPQSGKK